MSCLQKVLRMESQVFQGEAARVPLPAAAGQVLDAGWSECPHTGRKPQQPGVGKLSP